MNLTKELHALAVVIMRRQDLATTDTRVEMVRNLYALAEDAEGLHVKVMTEARRAADLLICRAALREAADTARRFQAHTLADRLDLGSAILDSASLTAQLKLLQRTGAPVNRYPTSLGARLNEGQASLLDVLALGVMKTPTHHTHA